MPLGRRRDFTWLHPLYMGRGASERAGAGGASVCFDVQSAPGLRAGASARFLAVKQRVSHLFFGRPPPNDLQLIPPTQITMGRRLHSAEVYDLQRDFGQIVVTVTLR